MPNGNSLQDFLGPNYQSLMSQFGTSGSNPVRPLARKAGVGLGIRALQDVAFGNELNPYKQSLTRQFLMNLNPANIQARIDALYRQNRSRAAQRAQLDAAQNNGMTPSLAAYNAQADRDTALAGQGMRSPGGMADAYGQSLNFINGMQDPASIMALSALQGQMQQSNMMKDPPNGGLGSLFGTIGQLSGMGAFNNLFKMGSPYGNLQGAVDRGALAPPDAGNPFWR